MRTRIARAITLLLCGLMLTTFDPRASHPVSAQTIPGTIAYMRHNNQTGDEIWLIEPDGSGNRRIWSSGQPDTAENVFGLSDLDWRPDSGAIAFSSQHEQGCSIYESDIFAIGPDGSGYRRITNSPGCAGLASYPKGSVSVTIRNFTNRNPLFVYVQGAPEVVSVLVPSGSSSKMTIADVADLGEGVLQQAIVTDGPIRWVRPTALADVKPGQTVDAGMLDAAGVGFENLGAYVPSWHSGSSRLGFIVNGCGGMGAIPAHPAANLSGTNLLQTENVLACVMDWGPTPALANQLLYWIPVKDGMADGSIYHVIEGSADRGTELLDTGTESIIDLQWLPDGSGFLFTLQNNIDRANIYHYDFASGDITQLTQFTDAFAVDVSVSPDGQWIVFERSATNNFLAGDLWIMRHDGTQMQLLVQNGMRPSWSQRAPQIPQRVYLPLGRG